MSAGPSPVEFAVRLAVLCRRLGLTDLTADGGRPDRSAAITVVSVLTESPVLAG